MIEQERTGPIDRLTWTFSRITMWGPAFIVAIIFYEVIARYIFFKPTLWVNEMSLWVGGMIFVTAGLYSMQQRSHIRIFVIYDIVPLWMKRVFDVLSTICVLIFAFAVVWGGLLEAQQKFFRWEAFGTAWDPPIPATNKPLVLVTVVVLGLQALSNLIRDWPANPLIRKAFDIVAGLSVIGACLYALPILFDFNDETLKTPMHWRLTIGALLLFAIVLCAIGLLRDFNRTPVPFDERSEEEDHGIPDRVLTGNPPAREATEELFARKDRND